MSLDVLFLGVLIFLAEVAVLTLGTVRTMVTVLGESKAAFYLGCFEMMLWIFGTSAVMLKVGEEPFLGVCYALGFACGNVIGIMAEKKLALGNVVIRIISQWQGAEIAQAIRQAGFGITTLAGEGSDGPVTVQFVVCRRSDMKHVLTVARLIDPELFYTFETAGGVSELDCPTVCRTGRLARLRRRVFQGS